MRYARRKRPAHKKAYRRKAKARRSSNGRGPSRTVVRGGGGKVFNDRYFCKLRYDYITTAAGLTSQYYQIAHNGMFDPYLGAGGGQPMGFDQLAALYLKYRVYCSDIRLDMQNLGTIPAWAIVYPLTSTSVPASLESDIEQRHSRHTSVQALSGGGRGTLRARISTKTLWGRPSKGIVTDDLFAAFTTANPVNTSVWNISFYSVDGATNLNLPFNFTVTYWCEFYDPVRLALS